MTTNEATNIVTASLDELRLFTNELNRRSGQADNSVWIGRASRKQLLAEIIRLYANSHADLRMRTHLLDPSQS
jgi:hypothetical protein